MLLDQLVLLDHVLGPFEIEGQLLLILGRNILLVQQLVSLFDIVRIKNGVCVNRCLKVINGRRRHRIGKQRGCVIRSEGGFDVLVAVHEVEHKGLLLKRRADSVQAGKRLDS